MVHHLFLFLLLSERDVLTSQLLVMMMTRAYVQTSTTTIERDVSEIVQSIKTFEGAGFPIERYTHPPPSCCTNARPLRSA
jgi:hypothetical protein